MMQTVATADTTLDQSAAQKILRGVKIPSQPTILVDIRAEQTKPNPNIQVISGLISRDVGLSAAVLKTINSPFYGLPRRIESIQQAAVLLGIKNVSSLVTNTILRDSVQGGACISLERFWDSAASIADISLMLAKRFYLPNPDDSYTLGLFHDCGIALMAQKFPDYVEVLKEGNSAVDRELTDIEDEHYNTNHALVGYYTCKSWGLSEIISNIVREHHNLDPLFLDEFTLRDQMMAVLKLASHIAHSFQRLRDDLEWERVKSDVLQLLDIAEDEYREIKKQVHDTMDMEQG